MPERNGELQITPYFFAWGCKGEGICPLKEVLVAMENEHKDGSEVGIETAVRLSRRGGLMQQKIESMLFNGNSSAKVGGKALLISCTQGTVRDMNIAVCGVATISEPKHTEGGLI